MNITGKLLLPLIVGMVLIVSVIQFHWEPKELERAKTEFEKHSNQLLLAGKSELVRYLLQNDWSALFSALDYLKESHVDEWFNISIHDLEGKRLYPLFDGNSNAIVNDSFIHIRYELNIEGTSLAFLDLDVDWSDQRSAIVKELNGIKILVVLIMVVIVLISLISQYRIVYIPLRRLKQKAEQVALGDFNTGLESGGSDEIGKLINAFLKMGHDLKTTQDGLIEAKERAEAATVSKGQFLSTMSHEIRTPMNGIIGMSQLMEDTPLNDEQKDYLETIQLSSNNLLSLINNILDFSKLDANMTNLEAISFNLERVCLDCLNLVAGNSIDKCLEFVFDYHPDCPRYFLGDPSRIRQILLNLIGNAVKFTHQGYVRLGISSNSLPTGKLALRLEIEDSGIGIKPNARQYLFDEFTQADQKTTRNFGGTGLGLAITRKLVRLMGGAIDVDSTYGKGSTFWINLQLPLSEPPKPLSSPSIVNTRILFVDDNPYICRIFERMLRHMGARPTIISNANQVTDTLQLALSEHDPYSIAILDHSLQDRDGLELGRQIRQNAAFEKLKLLILSSIGEKGDAAIFEEAGFDAYLNKLSDYQLLRNMLSQLLSNSPSNNIITRHSIEDARESSEQSKTSYDASILLVEDIVPNQIIAKTFLERMGATVDIAENGQQATDSYKSNRYDLIFMDCHMPVMNGHDATEAIRTIEKQFEVKYPIPIIGLTANASKQDVELCYQAGMNDVVTKPFKRSDLSNCLQKWLQGVVEN